MANLDEAFKTRLITVGVSTGIGAPPPNAQYGYICRICGGCYNYHKTKCVQSQNPHQFVQGLYRQLETFETYPFDDTYGYPLVN